MSSAHPHKGTVFKVWVDEAFAKGEEALMIEVFSGLPEPYQSLTGSNGNATQVRSEHQPSAKDYTKQFQLLLLRYARAGEDKLRLLWHYGLKDSTLYTNPMRLQKP